MSHLPYTVIRSARKTLCLELRPGGEIVVRCPRRMPAEQIRRFVESRRPWLEKQLQRQQALPVLPPLTKEEVKRLKQTMADRLPRQVEELAEKAGVGYGRITLRAQKTRWGSCSAKGDLSFNCLLALCPPEVTEYVILHELCHRVHMDHSPAFWARVEALCPDYRSRRQWLKDNGGALIARLPQT